MSYSGRKFCILGLLTQDLIKFIQHCFRDRVRLELKRGDVLTQGLAKADVGE
jgi:hypothetical protein